MVSLIHLEAYTKQYNEVQLSVYNNKQTDNNFMGVTILEVEVTILKQSISISTKLRL